MGTNCSFEGCLFSTQQVCARTGNSTPCEFATTDTVVDEHASAAPLSIDNGRESSMADASAADDFLHTGEELGLDEVGALMDSHYAHVITILGDASVGKTSFLVCLYLAAACGMLDDYGLSFAGSLTLPGFESRARASRLWSKDAPPSRMTGRTVYGDGRGAGFLHMDVVSHIDQKRVRLLMSDLPGEWTKEWIDNARYGERLGFLSRSDAVIIMVDGEKFIGRSRHVEAERIRGLVDRLIAHYPGSRVPLHLVATRGDKIAMEVPPTLIGVAEYARVNGFPCRAHTICTFSQSPDIRSASGLLDVLKCCLVNPKAGRPAQLEKMPERLFGWLPAMRGECS